MKKEKLLKLLFPLAPCTAVFTIFLIILFVAVQVIPLFFEISLFEFLTGSEWELLAGHFGVLPLVCRSFLVTLGNLLLGAPLSIAVAIFLSEIALTSIIRLVRLDVELLILAGLIFSPITGGIPACLIKRVSSKRLVRVICFEAATLSPVYSIVFGLFCLAFFAYFFELDYSMLAGALILALMILSVLMGVVKGTIMAFPQDFRWVCFELGISKWPAIREVVLTSATPRIIVGSISEMRREFVEAAAVFFSAFMAINLPYLPIVSDQTMTFYLYLLSNEVIFLDIAFGTSLLLLFFILLFNFLARYYGHRFIMGGS